jgi:hypothetical protein
MIKKKRRKYRKLVPTKEYIVMTEDARVFSGLKGGYPLFSESIDEAKQFTDLMGYASGWLWMHWRKK